VPGRRGAGPEARLLLSDAGNLLNLLGPPISGGTAPPEPEMICSARDSARFARKYLHGQTAPMFVNMAFVLFGLGFLVSRLATNNKSEVRSQPIKASVLGRNPLFRPSGHGPTRTKVGGGAALAPQDEPLGQTGPEESPRPGTAASRDEQGTEHRPPEP
jgi:hypothetical protein